MDGYESEVLRRPGPGDVVALALSGGVDSAVAAVTLLESGFQVRAFHLVMTPDAKTVKTAQRVAGGLGLDMEILDISRAFEERIVQPFIEDYARGLTPSPCVACNPMIKFDLLLRRALESGAAWVATGHYAALKPGPNGSGLALYRPRDRGKDQTYFLSRLTREMLSHAVFPLADRTKEHVKRQARRLGLETGHESQEFCFLAGEDYRRFLLGRLADNAPGPGDFVDIEGRVLGRHNGLIHYTVGQRRGLRLPGPEPLYVLALRPATNQVVVGVKALVHSSIFTVRDLVWSVAPESDRIYAHVQIRSRHRPARALVSILGPGRAEVAFEEPQPAITAGQAAAFYLDDMVLGGGWIDEARPAFDKRPPGAV